METITTTTRLYALCDIEHERRAQCSRRVHAPKLIRLGRPKRNWCPECKAYTFQNHTHTGGRESGLHSTRRQNQTFLPARDLAAAMAMTSFSGNTCPVYREAQ